MGGPPKHDGTIFTLYGHDVEGVLEYGAQYGAIAGLRITYWRPDPMSQNKCHSPSNVASRTMCSGYVTGVHCTDLMSPTTFTKPAGAFP